MKRNRINKSTKKSEQKSWLPEKLEKQVRGMEAGEKLKLIDEFDKLILFVRSTFHEKALQEGRPISWN